MVSRRGFLKILGGTAAAIVAAPILAPSKPVLAAPPAAPLFVPSRNLDMGVPRRILTATEMPKLPPTATLTQVAVDGYHATRQMAHSVPMMLLHDEYMTEWGGRLKAGSTLLVDQVTADRWLENRVAIRPDATAEEAVKVIPGRSDVYLFGKDLPTTPVPSSDWERALRLDDERLARDRAERNALFRSALRAGR